MESLAVLRRDDMDRFHIAKIAIVALAIAAAVAGTSMSSSQAQHHGAAAQSPYSAAVQLQDATWRAASCLVHSIRHVLFRY